MEPAWPILRQFRDSAGFHADKPLRFFSARRNLRTKIKQVEASIFEFEKLFEFFLDAEAKELPNFEEVLDSFLDELERAHGGTFRRAQFKAHVMIPTRAASARSA